MAPGSNKRKRPERQLSREDGSGRPSPHRPENLGLAQQQQGGARGGRGGRRQSRQGVGSPVGGVNAVPLNPNSRNAASPSPAAAGAGVSALRETPAVDGSRPVTPLQTMTGVSQPVVGEGATSTPAPYFYEYVTDARVRSWQDEGKSGVMEVAKEADEMAVSTILQELVRSVIDRRLDASEAGAVVRQMIAQHSEDDALDVQTLFLNTLSLLEDAEMKSSSLLALVTATDIDPDVIRQELDIPLLQALSLVRTTFTQMRTRKTTNILYRQANFNLLREETEGYAKLITEYFNTASEAVHSHDVSAENAFQRIKALVGSFDLDVGRVLDITLDISANLLVRAYGFVVKFYRCSSWWPDGGVLDNVKWEDQGFGAFPKWATPESERSKLDPEDEAVRTKDEKEQLALMRETRDVQFWKRVQEVGMDAFFELGARKIIDFEDVRPLLETEVEPEYDSRQKEINADRRKRINENRKYMKETGQLPPAGNSDAAQLLGFKLRFYASEARDSQDVLPENLIFLAALLIKIGFISLRDLYPHLYPADDKMPEEKARLEKEKAEAEAKERPGGGANALAMAGALTDDTLPVVRNLRAEKERSGGSTPKQDKKDDEPKEELPTPSNQKILLLKALLLIGGLPEALHMLGRFPWLVEVDTSLPPYLHRIARLMLTKVADSVRPLGDRDDAHVSRDELEETALGPDGAVKFKKREPKKVTKWLGLDKADKNDGQMYRHYYPDWEDNIPLCQNVEDVILLCNSFLGYLGVKIGQDAALHSTLVRIAKHSLTEDGSESNRTRWLDLMRRLLVPALSLSKHNPGITQEVYELLKFFPTTTRYHIYAEWYLGKTSRLPDMRVAFDHNRAEVKDVLRRVTNETGKKQARALAKISFSSPGVVMMSMISQLESYSNMIPSLVECTRYFSLLAYDVLTWCLINSMSGQGRDRMQADGMLTSPWLQALSQFVASLFYRYSVINPSPVLQYLASELRAGSSTDLEMFEQVLAEMAGIRSDMEFNDAQVLAMAGGEQLQAQVVAQLADKRYARQTQAQRLIKSLTEPGLVGQTLIAIAQERQMYPHHDTSKFMPLKVLGNNLDKIQSVFAQYLEVLKTNLKPQEFEAAVPDIIALVGEFGLEPGIAFTICRTAVMHRIGEHDTIKKQEVEEKKRRSSQEQAQTNGDAEMHDSKAIVNGSQPVANGQDSQEAAGETQESLASDESKPALTPQASGTAIVDGELQPWHPVLEPLIQHLPEVSGKLAESVSVPFFVTFWTLSLQDVLVHTESYTNEIKRLEDQVKLISADRSDLSALAMKERARKKKGLAEMQDKLRAELRARIAVYQKTRNRLSHCEKQHWFSRPVDKEDIDARHLSLLQECFLPRSMLSSLDAHYSYLMLKILHDNGTPNFSTMHLLNQLLRKQELAAIIFQCTAMEAQHFGRFLCETLKLLQHWHADKSNYEKEALQLGGTKRLPGFAKKFDANGEPESFLDFEDFRRLLFNWHSFLNGALQLCFESGEYMHIRNGIIVLKSVVQVFPSLNFMGHNMVKHVTKLSEEDTRQDLKLAAMSLLGPLRNREKGWMMPQAFRLNDPAKEAARSSSRAPEAEGERAGTPKLNAGAVEFKPGGAGLANGITARKESVAGKEDGEIEDEKLAVEKSGDEVMTDAPDVKQETEASPVAAEKQEAKEAPKEHAKDAEKPAPKPSTPAAVPSKPPPAPEHARTESSRPSSTQPPASSRPPHELPSRPEARPPNKPLPMPPNDRSSGRYPSRAEDNYGRLNRPASRDHSPGGRGRARTPEHDPYYGPGYGRGPARAERGPPRPGATTDMRHSRDDGYMTSRRDQPSQGGPPLRPSYDSRDRPNGAMGPPPPTHGTHPDRAGYINTGTPSSTAQQSSRASPEAAQAGQSTLPPNQHHENPARLALINDDKGSGQARGRDVGATNNDSRRDRDVKDDRGPTDARPNGGQAAPPEASREAPPRAGQPSDLAPTGPRRGRLSRDLGAQVPSESSYGRLNGSQDAPSGPRPPNGPSHRSSRNFAGPPPAPNARPNEPPLPSPTGARPSESPAAFRGPTHRQPADRRGSGQQFERQTSSTSVPTTPATESGPPVHPSRMNQVGVQPPPLQTNVATNGPRNAGSPTSAPPSGPRGPGRPPVGTPTGPSPSGPPSGPTSAIERQRRGDRQRADINATLQGTTGNAPNGQGVSFRGAAAQNRQPPNLPMPSSGNTQQPVQALASPLEPPPRRNEPVAAALRQDAPPSRADARPDLFQSRPERTEDMDSRGNSRTLRRREDERTDRQRGSRNPSKERRPDEQPPQRPPPGMEDRRDTRNSARDERRPRDERDGYDGPPSRAMRPDEAPMRRGPPQETPGSFSNPPPQEWERRGDGRGQRRDGPEENRRGGRGGGGGRADDFRGGRREDERRDVGRAPPRDDGPPPPGGRKRRHEDAPTFDESKRRRSGR